MSEQLFLTPKEVASRWRLSEQTLANWRNAGKGPSYSKIGNKVLYPITAVESFESQQPQQVQSQSNP